MIKYILPLFLVILSASCGEDRFSTTVDIPIPTHEPLPALTILEETTISDKTAQLELYRNGSLFLERQVELPTTNGINLELPLSEPISAEAAEYRFVATVEGFDPVESTQLMPAPFTYSLVSYEPDGAIEEVCDTVYNEVVFPLFLDSQDPLMTFTDNYGMVVPDRTFNGENYQIRILAENFNRSPIRLEVTASRRRLLSTPATTPSPSRLISIIT